MAKIKPQALLLQSKKKKGPSRVSIPTIMLYGVIVVVMVFFLFATYRHWSRREIHIYGTTYVVRTLQNAAAPMTDPPKYTTFGGSGTYLEIFSKSSSNIRSMIQTHDDLSTSEGENSFNEHKESDAPKYAFISTSKGSITVELYKDGSPDIVDEFVDFCQKGHFKGMQFIRVIKHFVIHGSKVDKLDATEDWTSREKHYNRLDTSLKHEAFMLGTSKTKQEGGGFDLFITTAPIPDLNDKINVFGRVIKGEDIVQEIEEVDTDDHYRPKTPVQINEVTLKYNI